MKTGKKWTATVVGLSLAIALQVVAQDGPGGKPPPRGDANGRTEVLTADQVEQVKTILGRYDAATLTADQAKAIHEAFRQAGIRGGPAVNDAVKAAGFDPEKLRDLAPPPGREGGRGNQQPAPRPDESNTGNQGKGEPQQRGSDARDGQQQGAQQGARGKSQYSLDQAISDRAQLSTIAFSGLAFVTGDFGPDTFIPPGKVCDYFGFQYMRDIDAAGKGHNPMFLDRVAGNVLKTLTDAQRKLFVDLAKEQAPQFNELALKRFPVIKAFCRELNGEIPSGSSGLSKDAVMKNVGDIFAFDAELSYRRAEVFGKIVSSFTPEQKATLARMKFGDFNTWPEVDMDQYKLPKGTDKSLNVAYMTYASEFFSWHAGSVQADVYFCPERHGTYFGGFYMKDMPAMGKKDYDISTAITGDSGEAFLKLLTPAQRTPITAIPDAQRKDLKEIIEVRQAVSVELRKYLKGETADKQKVLALGRRYGELDGEMSWMYATAFARANRTLTADQRATLKKLRNLEGYTSAPAYLYSTPMKTLPDIPDTDFFFKSTGIASATPVPTGVLSDAGEAGFVVKSPVVADGGQLPKEYTGDGESATLPLEWYGAPIGTMAYAVIMHHVDPEGKTKWYWTLYNIPADTKRLPKNVKDVGTLGNNSVNGRIGYAPPHSKGPGAKTYIYTVYALSSPVQLDVKPAEVSRDVLLTAMKGKILATAKMKVVYTRLDGATDQGGERGQAPQDSRRVAP